MGPRLPNLKPLSGAFFMEIAIGCAVLMVGMAILLSVWKYLDEIRCLKPQQTPAIFQQTPGRMEFRPPYVQQV